MRNVLIGLAILLMALAVPGINIYHHIELPTLNKYRIESHYKFEMFKRGAINVLGIHLATYHPSVYKQVDIVLEDTIYNQIAYEDVISTIRNANSGDVVVLHLAGYGGRVDAATVLINSMHNSKAFIVTHVEAPVYSAHAYIAANGDKLIMDPYTFLMFHFSTVLNLDCDTPSKDYDPNGLDRGVANQVHCNAAKIEEISVNTKILDDIKLLTKDEKNSIKMGYDIYIDKDTYDKRVK